jgi:isopenicillin N synthase-like dioxygenase
MDITVFDLERLESSSDLPIRRELTEAAGRNGYFFLRSTAVDELLISAVLDQAKAFFALPIEKKMFLAMRRSSGVKGYVGLGEELTNGKPDAKESVEFGRERSIDNCERYHVLYRENIWPQAGCLPNFREVVESYMQLLFSIGKRLYAQLSIGWELGPMRPMSPLSDHYFMMRLMHYPCQYKGDHNPLGVNPHTDMACFVMSVESAPGLEVLEDCGTWKEVAAPPGVLVVLLGQFAKMLSGNSLKACIHRVHRKPDSVDRISIPFFFYPDLDSELPVISASDDKRSKTAARLPGQMLWQRYESSFPGLI